MPHEEEVIGTIEALIEEDEFLRLYGLEVTCPTIVGSPHQKGFHGIQIKSSDPDRFTFRMIPYNQCPEPQPRRTYTPLYHEHYDVDAKTGKVRNKHGVSDIVRYIFPVERYAGKTIQAVLTPPKRYDDKDRLETSAIVMEVSSIIAQDPDKAELVRHILIAVAQRTDLLALYHPAKNVL